MFERHLFRVCKKAGRWENRYPQVALALSLHFLLLTTFIPFAFAFIPFLCRFLGFRHLILSQTSKMSLRKGSNVWIEDKERAWIPAEVVDVAENHAVVVTDTGKKVDL